MKFAHYSVPVFIFVKIFDFNNSNFFIRSTIMDLLIDLHYLPCIEYFVELTQHETIYLEACENFQKQSYRNRCEILTANKIDILTVPVIKSNSKILIKEVRIDYSQPWQKIHWRAIQSAYGKAPYFEYFADYFKNLYDKKTHFLWDLNLEALTLCLKLLQVKKTILFTSEYNKEAEIHVKEIEDKRSFFHPKARIESQVKYSQVFGREFAPNMSIIDLVLNEGPNGKNLVKKANK